MTIDDIVRRIRDIREQILETAAESLRANDERRYRELSDVAVRLTALIPSSDLPEDTVAVNRLIPASAPTIHERVESEYESVEIFARHGRTPYTAELDPSRISAGGRGRCVLFEGQWMTTSGAAGSITGTAVNGWKFWSYLRSDKSKGPIQELRDRQRRSEEDVPW